MNKNLKKVSISENFMLLYYGKKGSSEFLTPTYNLQSTPKTVLMTFLDADNKAGHISKNPFKFESYDLDQMAIYLGGESEHNINIDLPKNEGVNLFWELARTIGK